MTGHAETNLVFFDSVLFKLTQQSNVYVLHCNRVRRSMPPAGFTSILSVTDKQYGDILNFWGKSERAKPDIPQQLEFF